MHGGNNACLIDPRESHMDLLAETFYTSIINKWMINIAVMAYR